MSVGKKSLLLILCILVADQILKIWVKTHMTIGEEIPLFGKWGMLHFIENNGMAFGMEMGGKAGKILLSVFRIFAIIAISLFLSSLIRKKVNAGLIFAVSAILAGAIGNIIDSAFYGLIFSESFTQPAVMFPKEGGCSFLLGRVRYVLFSVINTHGQNGTVQSGRVAWSSSTNFQYCDSALCGVVILLFQKGCSGFQPNPSIELC